MDGGLRSDKIRRVAKKMEKNLSAEDVAFKLDCDIGEVIELRRKKKIEVIVEELQWYLSEMSDADITQEDKEASIG